MSSICLGIIKYPVLKHNLAGTLSQGYNVKLKCSLASKNIRNIGILLNRFASINSIHFYDLTYLFDLHMKAFYYFAVVLFCFPISLPKANKKPEEAMFYLSFYY